jgi:hypothetical protein
LHSSNPNKKRKARRKAGFSLVREFFEGDDMRCEICGYDVGQPTWVRPNTGGRRKAHFFCDESCKATGLKLLEAEGFKEAIGILGWDVFISN